MIKKVLIIGLLLITILGKCQTFLSVSDILNIRKGLVAETTSWVYILKNKGYNKTFNYEEGDDYAYKNCRLIYVDDKPFHSDGEYFRQIEKLLMPVMYIFTTEVFVL